MIKIQVDGEEQKERLLDILEGSSFCPFLGCISGCLTGLACRDCIDENIEFQIAKE